MVLERSPIINDNGHGYAIATYDVVQDKCSNLFSYDIYERYCLNAFCKIFGSYEDEFVTIG